ncbi:hypothetical protein FB45DRAFT_1125849 [Roridomyces roridus]|uniref:Uncharacterized protein n=1 Tax=Roridomyces roridus TaxID=1738132 RepID=A0AAD7C8L8_9AGAR|nr:hypothetical protein FB45DRAFT_1125849 [Roridomyces roridus]
MPRVLDSSTNILYKKARDPRLYGDVGARKDWRGQVDELDSKRHERPGLSPKARPSPARASSSPARPDIRLDRAQGSGLGNLRPAEARQARAWLCIRQAESLVLGKLSGAGLSLAECHLLPNRIFSDLLQDQASASAGMTPPTGRVLEPGLEAWAGLDAGSGSGSGNVKPKPAKAQPKPGLLGPARP